MPACSFRADTSQPSRRLFFALWPDEAMRQAMAQAIRTAAPASGGRPVPAQNLHVTLAFLGSVPERRLGELADMARAVAHSPGAAGENAESPQSRLEIAFDRLEYWRAAHLLCVLPAEPPAAVPALARGLQGRLAAGGWSFGTDTTRQFRPHVTVARKVYRPLPVMKIDPVIWSFAAFVLVDSRTLPAGSVYTVLQSFPLAGGAG